VSAAENPPVVKYEAQKKRLGKSKTLKPYVGVMSENDKNGEAKERPSAEKITRPREDERVKNKNQTQGKHAQNTQYIVQVHPKSEF